MGLNLLAKRVRQLNGLNPIPSIADGDKLIRENHIKVNKSSPTCSFCERTRKMMMAERESCLFKHIITADVPQARVMIKTHNAHDDFIIYCLFNFGNAFNPKPTT